MVKSLAESYPERGNRRILKKGSVVKVTHRGLAIGACALVFVSSASAAGAWTTKNMAMAARAIGYPKPHAKTLTCKSGFKCVATYTRHRRRVFYGSALPFTAGAAWTCFSTRSGCKPGWRGFAVGAHTPEMQGSVALLASRSYMTIKYNDPQPFSAGQCSHPAPPAFTYCYKLDTGSVAVTATVKAAPGGYTVRDTAALQP